MCRKNRVDMQAGRLQEVYKIVNELESQAFHDGHYLAFGFGAGSCRHTFLTPTWYHSFPSIPS